MIHSVSIYQLSLIRCTSNTFADWSTSSKFFQSIFLSAGTGLMTGTNNFVNPGQNLMAKELHTTITSVSRSVSLILLLLGVSAVISSPAARIWGKRPGKLKFSSRGFK
jgi:hypothetical protein